MILGIVDTDKKKILNFLLILGKFHLWNCRTEEKHITNSFKFQAEQLAERKYRTEYFVKTILKNVLIQSGA